MNIALSCVYTFMIFSQKFNLAELKFFRVKLHFKSHSYKFLYCDNLIG